MAAATKLGALALVDRRKMVSVTKEFPLSLSLVSFDSLVSYVLFPLPSLY